MKLYFIRHGETDHNVKGIVQGNGVDAPLNEHGKQQAHDAGKSITMHIDLIIASPLLRAQQTASIINEYIHAPIETREEIGEIDFGTLDNHTWDEIAQLSGNQNVWLESRKAHYDFTAHGGESGAHVKHRIATFVERIKKEHPDASILVVTHAGIIRMAHHLLKNEEKHIIENAQIHEFDI